jgi:hypothetical protein
MFSKLLLFGSLALGTSTVAGEAQFRRTNSNSGGSGGSGGSKGDGKNIILIVADDMGLGDIGYNTPEDKKFHTPNLDSLAANGIKLTRTYVGKEHNNYNHLLYNHFVY